MADIVHARDDQSQVLSGGLSAAQERPAARRAQGRPDRPRSDIGTLTIHWLTALAFFVSIFTGVRIAADDPDAVVSKWLAPITPQGEIWTWHFFAGLTLFFCTSAYILYMARSGLAPRIALKKVRAFVIPRAGKLRYDALNVVLHWLVYVVVVVLTTTGIFLYLGYGGWLLTVHLAAAFTGIAYTLGHLLSHFLYGGLQQWLRLFRPSALVPTRATRPYALAAGLAAGVAVAAALAGIDWGSRPTLVMHRVPVAPNPAKLLDDPVWANIAPVRVQTSQGINLGGTGESMVEIRAVHDGKKAYFAFRWEDPTRSMRREPLIKRADGWHIIADNTFIDDVMTMYEDKFAVIFSPTAQFGSGGVAHFGPNPLGDKVKHSRNGRGLHYTDGTMVDMWQWKASRGGLLGEVDDMFIGPPTEPTPEQASQQQRYQGGYWGDPGDTPYTYNFKLYRPSEYKEGDPVEILRLPKDYRAMNKAMGTWNPELGGSVDDGSKWWMFLDESVPYSKEEDAKIPVGTIIPAVLITGKHEGDRYDVKCAAHWADGHWTMVASRVLDTGSKYDQPFLPGYDLYVWVAVFDHTQTRHTRHPRPVRLTVEE
ncbi:MAG TPA: ethylbenzene dehydrogenase-related protein [Xanthobacteraceae bacterium]|jgi:cytochrome b561|nr:ethylbenzene dehydrogenase-related protein [Xanthobacteraceae bacterium]